jgi:predicted nicotinamide N-methyase
VSEQTATIVIEVDIGPTKLKIEQLADLDEAARESVYLEGTEPYWAYLWPSAKALAKYVGENLELSGKRALDLGCGLGAVGVAARFKGAAVVVSDVNGEAVELAKENAKRNQLEIEGRVFDWNQPPEDLGQFEVITASDVLYDDGMLAGVIRFMKKHLSPLGTGYIADPMRIMKGGVAGAARLHGLGTTTQVLAEGDMMTGGVTLYELKKRVRPLIKPKAP